MFACYKIQRQVCDISKLVKALKFSLKSYNSVPHVVRRQLLIWKAGLISFMLDGKGAFGFGVSSLGGFRGYGELMGGDS